MLEFGKIDVTAVAQGEFDRLAFTVPNALKPD